MNPTSSSSTRAAHPAGDEATEDPLRTSRSAPPSLPADLVARPRLVDLVRHGVGGPLTLLSAPAGTGKTVLLASWVALEEAPGPVAWRTLEAGDERPGVFWSSVVEGLRNSGVDITGAGVPIRADAASGAMLARLASRLADHATPVVLVLDHADRLVDPRLGQQLADLVRSARGNLRLVVLTRVDPALPLHLFRLKGAVTEIRASDLAFTEPEAALLFERAGLQLDAAQAQALNGRTRGWPVGLRFAAMSLARRTDTEQAIRDFTGDAGDVASYLTSEVLDTQVPAMREVLLRTSIADDVSPELLEALSGQPHGQRVLEFMAHGNAFLQPVAGRTGLYRYQPLFREFLRAQLAYEQPSAVPHLHRLAADWLAQHGALLEAARHAAAADQWGAAAAYLVDDLAIGTLLAGRGGVRLSGLFTALPDDVTGCAASLVRAALAITAGDLDRCTAELDLARRQLEGEDEGTRHVQRCRLSLAVLDALRAECVASVDEAVAAAELAERLLQTAPVAAVVAHQELTAVVALCKGRLLLRQGELVVARRDLAAAARSADRAGCEEVLAESLGLGALAEALRGRLRRAVELAERARAVAGGTGTDQAHGPAAAATALAWVRMEEYDVANASALVDEAEATAVGGEQKITQAVLMLVRARLLRADGDLAAARGKLLALRASRPAAWLDRWAAVAEADLLGAMGRPHEAIETIQQLAGAESLETFVALQQARIAVGEAGPSGTGDPVGPIEAAPLDTQVAALLLRATLSAGAGDAVGAEQALERSLWLAAPEHLRRPFREAWPAVRQLFEQGSGAAERHPWLGAVGRSKRRESAGTTGARQVAPSSTCTDGTLVVDTLTNKEQEVLEHLAQLLTTEEIAETMFVSVNTVRTHVRSILRKLGAPRRNEAVRRAWELQLLPRRSDTVPLQRRASR